MYTPNAFFSSLARSSHRSSRPSSTRPPLHVPDISHLLLVSSWSWAREPPRFPSLSAKWPYCPSCNLRPTSDLRRENGRLCLPGRNRCQFIEQYNASVLVLALRSRTPDSTRQNVEPWYTELPDCVENTDIFFRDPFVSRRIVIN